MANDHRTADDLRSGLQRAYSVQLVRGFTDACSVLERTAPDVIVLDLALPGGEAIYLLDFLNGYPGDVPPVVVTGSRTRDPELAPFQHLVALALTKPLQVGRLSGQVEAALAEWRRPGFFPDNVGAPVVLLADSRGESRIRMATVLREAGAKVSEAETLEEAVHLLDSRRFDAVVSHWMLSGGTARRIIEQGRATLAGTPVIVLANNSSPAFVQRVLSLGAADLLIAPLAPEAVLIALEKLRYRAQAPRGPAAPEPRHAGGRHQNGLRYGPEDIIGFSPSIHRARTALQQVARMDSTVLLSGETGVGKELFAHALHNLSARRSGAFVAVNAAAIPEALLESELFGYSGGAFTGAKRDGHRGKFLQATGGTLFLDEIGDLPLTLQGKLLRVLQEGEIDPVGGQGPVPVDVRLVAATHRDLAEMVRLGSFRSDLYFRLNVVTIPIPPLRERPEDIVPLAATFLAELCHRYGLAPKQFTPESLELLRAYGWPGNVRELRNVVEQAFVFTPGTIISPENLPAELHHPVQRNAPAPLKLVPLESNERDAIEHALVEAGGNKAKAARLLGISRAGLYVKLKVYGLG